MLIVRVNRVLLSLLNAQVCVRRAPHDAVGIHGDMVDVLYFTHLRGVQQINLGKLNGVQRRTYSYIRTIGKSATRQHVLVRKHFQRNYY